MKLISLTTDFGLKDWFVGTVKAVIHTIHPGVTIVDLTHDIPSGDIRAGAFALAASYRYFPRHTIHVAVVDPGVGSRRSALAVQTTDYFFVGPDNGVLSWALAKEKIRAIRRLENPKWFLQPSSHTFHGRDLFAPVAAHLSQGWPLAKAGPTQRDLVRLPWPQPTTARHALHGEVLYIDRFGNAITNLPNQLLDQKSCTVHVGRRIPLALFYQAVPSGKPVALPGSSGFFEIAVNGGSAARQLHLKIGSKVTVRCS